MKIFPKNIFSLLPFESTTIDALVRFGNILNTRLNRGNCEFEIPRGDDGLRLEQNVVDEFGSSLNRLPTHVPHIRVRNLRKRSLSYVS